jgi:PleD family two-component response regulator
MNFTLQALQHRADKAMYQTKKAGRNRMSTLQVAA